MDAVDHQLRAPSSREALAPHIAIVLGIASVGIAMRVYGLNWLFDYDGVDEGVYWQTLRAMRAGFGLYDQVFYAQPPFFLLSLYPFYALFGQSIVAARAGVAALSLLGLLGAYLMGKALAGRAGAILAMILLVFTPIYLAQSQVLDAEGPATAFLLLSVGAALMWWERPVGKTGTILAIVCGAALSLGIFIKLLNVTAAAPILILVVWRIWTFRQESSSKILALLTSVSLGFIVTVVAALIVLMPFLASLGALQEQVVTYHLAAKNVSQTDNFQILARFFTTNGVLSIAAIVALFLALVRHDWRAIPLLAWLLTTLVLLAVHAPLFARHAVLLIPPLIAIVALGLKDLPSAEQVRQILRERTPWTKVSAILMGLLVFAAVLSGMPVLYSYYSRLNARAESSATRVAAEIAADLQRVTTPDQWIITDAQFVAALADRDTPPSLVDTSRVRILTGYLTSQELLQAASDPRVHVVLFATNRFALRPIADFRRWVAEHFALVRSYSPGVELWIR